MTPYLQTAGWSLIHFVWQGAAIAGATSVLLRLMRHRSASARYVIACASLAAMLAGPAVTARLLWTGQESTCDLSVTDAATSAAAGSGAARFVNSVRATGPDSRGVGQAAHGSVSVARGLADVAQDFSPAIDRLLPGITLAWLAGVVLLLARMAGGWWHVRRLHRLALASRSSRWQTACRRLAYRIGLPAAAHVVESALVDVPTVVGWLRPAILLPIAALASLSPSQIEAILAHELAHIRRHDYAVNVLQTIAETLLFYHPAVWWLSKRIRIEREHCCDDIAIAICGDPVSYAHALAELETWRTASAAMAMAATGGSLLGRVRRILHAPIAEEPRSPSWAVTLALTMVFTAGAGSVQHLPWISTQGDARAASAPRAIVEAPAQAPPPAERSTGGPDAFVFAQDEPRPPRPPRAPRPPRPPRPPQWTSDWAAVDFAPTAPPAPPAPPPPPAPPQPPSPPAPPAPPTPPAPPVPPAPSSTSPNGSWHMSWSDGPDRLDIRINGKVTFTDDLTDVQTMSGGGSLTLRSWSGIIPHTVEITSSNGALERTYYVAGLKRPWDDEARRFLSTQLPALVRQTGIGADDRVKSIFGKDGVSGVLKDIDLLRGDYARRLYFTALIDVARFDSAGVQPILQRVGQTFKSDYDRRQVLEHIASRVTLDQKGAAAYVQAMATMKSDYDQRKALSALNRHGGTASGGAAMLPALANMKSSYDKRVVLADLLDRGGLSVEVRRTVLAGVPGLQSDYDRRQVLIKFIQRFSVDAAVRETFFTAVRAITSNYDRREVLTALAKNRSAVREVQEAVFGAVADMTSDYDRAETLLAFVATMDAASRPAFVSAAERITSSHDQNRVLAALLRAERR